MQQAAASCGLLGRFLQFAPLTGAARRKIRRFLLLSSTGVYGHNSLLDATEDQPLAPDTPLSRSRCEAERLGLVERLRRQHRHDPHQ